MQLEEIKIPINEVEDHFDKSLNEENNSRIFFSGQFGIGKTYFLNEFFNSKKDEYDVFHLYPVNYQISSNEDIFELLKYDILIELLKKDSEIFKENEVEGIKDSALLFYSWFKEKITINSSLDSALSMADYFQIPILNKLGKPLKDLLKIDKEYQSFKKDYKKGEKKIVEEFTSEIEKKNISETDFFSQFLKDKIKIQKGSKKSILILDDLDRVDPEHVFRILNVLSAYFEKEDGNKFGFDKIIVVAHCKNIENIFYHKYGANTDFSGYLDKFFSISPYDFDNKKAVISMVDKIVKNIKNEEASLNDAMGEGGYIKLFLEHIFTKAVDAEAINLRVLLKATKYQLAELKKGSFYKDHFSDDFQKLFDIGIKIAILCFSSKQDFIEKIIAIKDNNNNSMDARMPFDKYINKMLEVLAINVLEKGKIQSFDWNEYKIESRQNNELVVEGKKKENLFYDLLIKYVVDKKYIKNDNSEYRS